MKFGIIVNKLYLDNNIVQINNVVDKGIDIIIVSNSSQRLKKQYSTSLDSKVRFLTRNEMRRELEYINSDDNIIYSVLGIVKEDAIFSFNFKIPLFYLNSYEQLEVFNEVKVKKYGLKIDSIDIILKCYDAYKIVYDPYFSFFDGNKFRAISLYNANTYFVDDDEKRLKEMLQRIIKGNEFDNNILSTLTFLIIKYLENNVNLHDKNTLICSFPSSNFNNVDTPIHYIKEKIRTIFNIIPKNGVEVFKRVSNRPTKHYNKEFRYDDKCESDFKTLIINEKVDVVDKNIIVIDDYMTSGYSAEAAKNILRRAGVGNIFFITVGKFGSNYISIDYDIEGDVTKIGYLYKEVSCKNIPFYNYVNNDPALLNGLTDILMS